MKQYLELLEDILAHGVDREDRTGTGTRSVFGRQLRFDLNEGFPLVTTKKIYTQAVIGELIWMIGGDTNIRWLNDRDIHIWDEWADAQGELGPVYGAQWRTWNPISRRDKPVSSVDQIATVIEGIKNNPNSRRHIVTAWNPTELDEMALPPCHMMFQFYVANGKLSCQLYQRSADVFLGVPFNIASYALLTHMIAQVTDLGVGDFVHTFGDVHIYKNHFKQVHTQLEREPYPLPELELNPAIEHIDDFAMKDVVLKNYQSHPAIKAEVSV